MDIQDLSFELEILEFQQIQGGKKKSKIPIRVFLPPGVPQGSKVIDVACTASIPGSCATSYKTPSGKIITVVSSAGGELPKLVK